MLDPFIRSMIYPAPGMRIPSPPPPPYAEVRLETTEGELLAWASARGAGPGAPVVLFFHGNGENLATLAMGGALEAFDRLGVVRIFVDYPGYGESTGEPSEASLAAAADATLDWAEENHPGRAVVAAGWSLGAAVALGLADRHQDRLAGVVALSAWTSLPDIAGRIFPRLLVDNAPLDPYDSRTAAHRIELPALIMHGTRDRIIPAGHGEAVARALAGPARWVEVPGAGHNDLLGQPEVWTELERFLAGVGSGGDDPP